MSYRLCHEYHPTQQIIETFYASKDQMKDQYFWQLNIVAALRVIQQVSLTDEVVRNQA